MISLCMIVKNEEHNLARCLTSAKDCVDEMIIVDTGSTDNTINIAKEFGAMVLTYQWQDDFAAARNYSISQAKGDWILYLDADEELEPNCANRLRGLTNLPNIEGYIFQINNLTDGNAPLRHINLRMFKNKPAYRFEGPLHEQIMHAIVTNCPPGTQVINSGINIFHYGYQAAEFMAKNKAHRNYRINKRLVDNDPTNPFYLYTLGGSCINMQDFAGAADYYKKALEYVNLQATYAPSIFISYITCLLKMGKLQGAAEYIDKCKATYPDYVDIHFIEGELYNNFGHITRAQGCFETCLRLGEQAKGKYTTRTGVGSFLPAFELAQIHKKLGDHQQAIQYQVQGLKFKNDDMQQYVTLAKLLKDSLGDGEKVYQVLRANIVHQDKVTGCLILGRLLYEIDEYPLALRIFETLPPDKEEVHYHKAKNYIKWGKHPEAADELSKIITSNLYQEIAEELILAHWASSPPQDALAILELRPWTNQVLYDTLKSINSTIFNHTSNTDFPSTESIRGVLAKLLTRKGFEISHRLLTLAGMETAHSQISYLLYGSISEAHVDFAARIALQEIKKHSVHPDFLYTMGYYFFNNNELAAAQDMVCQALNILPSTEVYKQLLRKIYLKFSLEAVLAALKTYPANPAFNHWLVEIQNELAINTTLKGVH